MNTYTYKIILYKTKILMHLLIRSFPEIAVRSRVNEIQEDWKPTFLTNEEFTHLILEAVDGFIIVFSTNGQIYYASESITSLLGHLPVSHWKNTSLNFAQICHTFRTIF